MSARRPPLTKAAHGSTRCVGCGKRFAMTPGVGTVDIETEEQNRNRYGGFSGPYSATKARRRWHADCLAEFEESNERSRERADADHEQAMRDLCQAAGLDYETVKAKSEANRWGARFADWRYASWWTKYPRHTMTATSTACARAGKSAP